MSPYTPRRLSPDVLFEIKHWIFIIFLPISDVMTETDSDDENEDTTPSGTEAAAESASHEEFFELLDAILDALD